MRVVFLSQSFLPNKGGVESHISQLLPYLQKAGWQITIVTANFNQKKPREKLASYEKNSGAEIYRFSIPQKKFLALFGIWGQLLSKIKLFLRADLIIIHDIFIYFLPLRILMPWKKVFTVFHGWETQFPIPAKNIFYKQLAQRLSAKTISIGQYINKFYHLKQENNFISYGAATALPSQKNWLDKKNFTLSFLGRLEADTGIEQCLVMLEELRKDGVKMEVNFCGNGSYAALCQKYGQVLGLVDPKPYLLNSQFAFVGGYLSLLEAMKAKNVILTSYNNPLKKAYWQEHPLYEYFACQANSKTLAEHVKTRLKDKTKTAKQIERAALLSRSYSYQQLSALYLQLAADELDKNNDDKD